MRRLVLVIVLCLTLTGCGRVQPKVIERTVAKKATLTTDDGCVRLEEVSPPVWNEVFAVVTANGIASQVEWGTGKDWVMSDSSGYPGFNHPMLIVTEEDSVDGMVELVTNYGKYYYECKETFDASLTDDGKNLVDQKSGEELISFGKSRESLWIFCKKTRKAVKAKKVHGTLVVVT